MLANEISYIRMQDRRTFQVCLSNEIVKRARKKNTKKEKKRKERLTLFTVQDTWDEIRDRNAEEDD